MSWQDRVKEFRRVPVSELKANPKNWREHPPEQQKAMAGILEEVGIAGALLARETEYGLELIDGHLRTEMNDAAEWPVLILDVDENEADILLASVDPIGAMAKLNDYALAELLDGFNVESQNLNKLFEELRADSEVPTFLPAEESEQGHLDELAPKMVKCPKCGVDFDLRKV